MDKQPMNRQQLAVEARELMAVENVVRRRLTQMTESIRQSQDFEPDAKRRILERLDLTLTEVARTSNSLDRLTDS